jgi:hypothetical protein
MKMNKAMKDYEGSKADMKADKAGAKKASVSVKKYEGSKADMKADKAAVKKKR